MHDGTYIHVRVATNARKENIQKNKNMYHITVREKAQQGQANARVKDLLSEALHCSPKQLRLIKGATTPSKTFLLINTKSHDTQL